MELFQPMSRRNHTSVFQPIEYSVCIFVPPRTGPHGLRIAHSMCDQHQLSNASKDATSQVFCQKRKENFHRIESQMNDTITGNLKQIPYISFYYRGA